MPLRSRRWLPALPGHEPPRSIMMGKATNPQPLGLRRRALIFGDSGSNNRATAATPKTASQAEPPPFPHLQRCPPVSPIPDRLLCPSTEAGPSPGPQGCGARPSHHHRAVDALVAVPPPTPPGGRGGCGDARGGRAVSPWGRAAARDLSSQTAPPPEPPHSLCCPRM